MSTPSTPMAEPLETDLQSGSSTPTGDLDPDRQPVAELPSSIEGSNEHEHVSGERAAISALSPGTTIAGRYIVHGPLGVGGQGAVHRAVHVTLEMPVAVKVLDLGARSEHEREELAERFTREARTIARIRHRNVLAIHDAGLLPDGAPYLVTELIDGEDLEQRIARGALSIAAAVDLGRQLFSALSAIAEGGVIHRDVKPANLMLHRERDGHVHVTLIDFGIARESQEVSRLTVTGQILGTAHYMAPEQLRGESLDARADLYAGCVVLYEALTGRPPFDGASSPVVIGKILGGTLEPVLAYRPDCPVELARLIERGLSRSSAARPPHPLAVVNELGLIAQRLGLPTGPLAWAEDEPFRPVSPLEASAASAVLAELLTADVPLAPRPPVPDSGPVALPASVQRKRFAAVLAVGAVGIAIGLGLGLRGAPPSAPTPLVVAGAQPSQVPPTVTLPPSESAPVDVAPLLHTGLEALARGEMEQALVAYRAACEADPDRPEAQRGRGLAASRAGLEDEAILAFERYLSLSPDASDGPRVRARLRDLRARRAQREQQGSR